MSNPSTVWTQLAMPNPPAGSVPFVASDGITITTDVANFSYIAATSQLSIKNINFANILVGGQSILAAQYGGTALNISNPAYDTTKGTPPNGVQHSLATTLAPSGAGSGGWTNFQSSVTLTGTSGVVANVGVGNDQLLLLAGAAVPFAYAHTITGINEGNISGSYTGLTLSFENSVGANAGTIIGMALTAQWDSTSAGNVGQYIGIWNELPRGNGSLVAVTTSTFILNSDSAAPIISAGALSVGSGSIRPAANIRLQVTSPAVPVFTVDNNGTVNTSGAIQVTGTQVVGAHVGGWSPMTGTSDFASVFAVSTVTLVQLAERVNAIQAALTTHGLIGA